MEISDNALVTIDVLRFNNYLTVFSHEIVTMAAAREIATECRRLGLKYTVTQAGRNVDV
jgi:hypothetical protein